jgi:hypothetical protein
MQISVPPGGGYLNHLRNPRRELALACNHETDAAPRAPATRAWLHGQARAILTDRAPNFVADHNLQSTHYLEGAGL